MNTFKSFFVLERKKFFSRRNIALTILFAVVSLYFIQTHSQHYKSVLRNCDEVVKLEKDKVGEFKDYTKYATVGVTLNLVPPPTCIFFYNSGLFMELTSRFDAAHILDIYVSMKGKNSFSERSAMDGDYSSWLLWVGTLAVLFYGLETYQRIKYYRMITSFTSLKKTFWFTLMARYLVLSMLFLALTGLALVLVRLNGIAFASTDYLVIACFVLVWLFVSLIFFLIGTVIGLAQKKSAWIAMITWIILIYLSPLMDNKISIETATPIPSNVSLDSKKWNIVNRFEERMVNELGKFTEEKRKDANVGDRVKSFIKREYIEIQNIEKKVEQATQKNLNTLQGLWAFLPSTFFYAVTHEMSGKGFESINRFYRYTQGYKDQFIAFFLNNKYCPSEEKVFSFVKNKENLYFASSHMPGNFLLGLIICVLYVFLLLLFSWSRFKNLILGYGSMAVNKYSDVDITIQKGEFRIFEEKGAPLTDILFNHFVRGQKITDKNRFSGNIHFSGLNTATSRQIDFLFLCSPTDLPGDIITRDFIVFFCALAKFNDMDTQQILKSPAIHDKKEKRVDELSHEERAEILLTLTALKNCDVYLFHETATGARYEFTHYFRQFIADLAAMDKAVLYITSDSTIRHKSSRDESYFYENRLWTTQIDIRLEKNKID